MSPPRKAGQRTAPAKGDRNGALWVELCQDLSLVSRFFSPGQSARLVTIGKKNVSVPQGWRDLFHGGHASSADHHVQGRHYAALFRFPEESGEVLRPEGRQDHVPTHVQNTRAVQRRKINIRGTKIGIGSDTVEIAPVFSRHVDDVGVRGRMAAAPGHARRVNAKAFEVLQHKVAEQIFSDFANHSHVAPQPPQACRGVGGAPARAQNVPVDQPQLSRRGQRINRACEDVGNQDPGANHVHKLDPRRW